MEAEQTEQLPGFIYKKKLGRGAQGKVILKLFIFN